VPGPTPNGLLPGRGEDRGGPAGRCGAGTGAERCGAGAGAGRGPGRTAPGSVVLGASSVSGAEGPEGSATGAAAAAAAASRAACCAARWAACSSMTRACSALTSMSWALAVPPGRANCAGEGAPPGPGRRGGGPGLRVPGLAAGPPGAAATGAPAWLEDGPEGSVYASRNLRATGASIVDDADFTNSPSSLSLVRTSLLGMPSSLASSCTRALPATALLVRSRAATRSTSWLLLKTDHREDFIARSLPETCFCSVDTDWMSASPGGPDVARAARYSWRGAVSRTPLTRSARPKARRRSASARQARSGCSDAPRPGNRRAGSGISVRVSPFDDAPSGATTRNSSAATARWRHPTHSRTGARSDGDGAVLSEERARLTIDKSTPETPRRRRPAPLRPRVAALYSSHWCPRRRCGCRCASP
jgi:hypothetical protein